MGTPIFAACRHGHVGCLHLLLDGGATPDLDDKTGVTPLIVATMYGHVECVEVLLNAGVQDLTGERAARSKTALEVACELELKECIKLLKESTNGCVRKETEQEVPTPSRGSASSVE